MHMISDPAHSMPHMKRAAHTIHCRIRIAPIASIAASCMLIFILLTGAPEVSAQAQIPAHTEIEIEAQTHTKTERTRERNLRSHDAHHAHHAHDTLSPSTIFKVRAEGEAGLPTDQLLTDQPVIPSVSSIPSAPPYQQYAERFWLSEIPNGECRLLQVNAPDGAKWNYALIPQDDAEGQCQAWAATQTGGSIVPIAVPVERIATLSSTQFFSFVTLEAAERVTAHNGTQWLYTPEARARLENGLINIGAGAAIDVELLVASESDIVLHDLYSASQSTFDRFGIETIIYIDHLETTPLGRAEWIIVAGALIGKLEEAIGQFEQIAERYNTLRRIIEAADITPAEEPSVMIGAPWGGQWPVSGSGSYEAQLIADAGGRYVWQSQPQYRDTVGTIMVDFEAAYARGKNADIWIHTGIAGSLADLAESDSRIRWFMPFENKKVFNNDARRTVTGGTDYYESGALRADILLADLIHIFHPSLMPHRQLVYYRQLE